MPINFVVILKQRLHITSKGICMFWLAKSLLEIIRPLPNASVKSIGWVQIINHMPVWQVQNIDQLSFFSILARIFTN